MKRNDNMTQGNALGIIIRFAVPIMLSSLLQYNYHLVDNILVGRFVGTDALAAVGNVGSVNSFIIGAALGLTAGFTTQSERGISGGRLISPATASPSRS